VKPGRKLRGDARLRGAGASSPTPSGAAAAPSLHARRSPSACQLPSGQYRYGAWISATCLLLTCYASVLSLPLELDGWLGAFATISMEIDRPASTITFLVKYVH
jgi:hypothetical protein